MHIHTYTHGLPDGDHSRHILETLDVLVRYLRDHDGRSDIALWQAPVDNTAWLGGHPLLMPGTSIIYVFSRN